MLIIWASLIDLPAWMLVSLGFYIAYRVLRFPDLTVDASFVSGTVGAACGAIYWASSSLGLLVAISLSSLAGLLTSIVYLVNPRPSYKLLAGVLVVFGFYSINYRVLSYKTEAGFSTVATQMNYVSELQALYNLNTLKPITFLIGFLIIIITVFLFKKLLHTRYGLILRSVGSRKYLLSNKRLRPAFYLTSGLILSNVIVGIGGWFYGSINSFATINVFGSIIHALAAAIIGEVLIEKIGWFRDRRTSVWVLLLTPLIGAFIYQLLRAIIAFLLTSESNVNQTNYSINMHDHNTLLAIIVIMIVLAIKAVTLSAKYDLPNEDEDGA